MTVSRGAKLNEAAKIPGCNDALTNGKPANEPTRAMTAHRVARCSSPTGSRVA